MPIPNGELLLLTQRTDQPPPVYSQTPIVESAEEYTWDGNAQRSAQKCEEP